MSKISIGGVLYSEKEVYEKIKSLKLRNSKISEELHALKCRNKHLIDSRDAWKAKYKNLVAEIKEQCKQVIKRSFSNE